MTVYLDYFDHTPKDYEPPHFEVSSIEQINWASEEPDEIGLGEVITGHHA